MLARRRIRMYWGQPIRASLERPIHLVETGFLGRHPVQTSSSIRRADNPLSAKR